jgi:enoyl-CoA hydratase/carnithine racemase
MTSSTERLRVEVEAGVATATLANPPLNLMTLPLFADLARFSAEVAADDSVRAVVLRSDDPEFWIAHFDVEAILQFPTNLPAQRAAKADDNPFHALCERFRSMPKAVIAEIGGRVGGGGSEFVLSCDMRFGARAR